MRQKKVLRVNIYETWFVRQKTVLGANIHETQGLLEQIFAETPNLLVHLPFGLVWFPRRGAEEARKARRVQ